MEKELTPESLDLLKSVVRDFEAVSLRIKAETNTVVASGDHVEVIKHFDTLRKANDQIKQARELLTELADELSRVNIPDIFAAIKMRTGQKPPFVIEGVGRVTVSHRFSCSIITEDKKVGYEWLKDNGHGGLVIETVPAPTLGAFAKSLLEDKGEELPPDIFKVGTSPFTSITKV